jgi:hypothetical protein
VRAAYTQLHGEQMAQFARERAEWESLTDRLTRLLKRSAQRDRDAVIPEDDRPAEAILGGRYPSGDGKMGRLTRGGR